MHVRDIFLYISDIQLTLFTLLVKLLQGGFFIMLLKNYSRSHTNILNKLSIPEITEPIPIRVLWFRPFSFHEKNSIVSTEMHLHNYFEAHFIMNGTMEYSSKNQEKFILNEGTGILISPCTDHIVDSYSNNCFRFSLAFIVDESFDFYKQLVQKGFYTFDLLPDLLYSIETILNELDLNTNFSLILIRNRILDIICTLSRTIGICEYSSPLNLTIEDKRVTAAKLYIKDNINKFITCQEVAAQCGLSPKQLNRLFFTATEKNLHEYIDMMKLKEAEHLLLETTLPIKVVSERLGFSSVYYFNRFFSKNTGLPPAYFRSISTK